MLQRMEAVVLFYSPSNLGRGPPRSLSTDSKSRSSTTSTITARRFGSKPRSRASSTCTAFLIGCKALSSHCTTILRKPVSLTRRRKLPDHTARAKDFAHGPA
jgi:hypothetical protein